MPLDVIKAKVKELLEGIEGMGRVYTHEVWAVQQADIRKRCMVDGRINYWAIVRERSEEPRYPSRVNERHHHLLIVAFYSLDNHGASEDTFEQLIESICTLFRTKPALERVAETSGTIEVNRPDPHRYLGEVLCHYAELRIDIQELITW
jgi:hypothetical protein